MPTDADLDRDVATRRLPQRTAELTGVAQDIVRLSARLLIARDAALLCVPLAVPPASEEPVCFDRSSLADTRPWIGAARAAADRRRLRKAAAALYPMLMPHWPPYARPRRLGLITDGSGLGFSPEDPWPLSPGWMARQVNGESWVTQIIPFAAGSPWTLLAGSPPPARAH